MPRRLYVLVRGSAIHSFMNRMVHDLGATLQLRIKVSSFDALCRMVEANVGIEVLPESAARRQCQCADISLVALSDPWARRDMKICVCRLALDTLPTFARELVAALAATRALRARKGHRRGLQEQRTPQPNRAV